MRTIIASALTLLAFAAAPAAAVAGPDLPTTGCELQEFLGVENVKDCEDF